MEEEKREDNCAKPMVNPLSDNIFGFLFGRFFFLLRRKKEKRS
jgi:hypothetical protein